MSAKQYLVSGAGLGFRRSMVAELNEYGHDALAKKIGFWEVAPENWMNLGGKLGKSFRAYTERHPFICHGLSLSIGSPAPLDVSFVKNVAAFLKQHDIRFYSEHLSYCSDDGHLYDLMPIPFTEEAVKHVAARIRQVQDIIERKLIIENVSYYAAPGKQMEEIEFLNAVLEEADCELLLDVNNIYVNSVNHRYDPVAFLKTLPAERIAYIHTAGHYNEADDLIVDTHGANVVSEVWDILDKAYEHFGVIPTLLERDFNIPPLADMLGEVSTISDYQDKWSKHHARLIA